MSTKTVDPFTFEIVRHRLLSVMEETIIALENVSGSPITNEGHDLMAALYRADGALMVGGVGFLHHLTSAAQAVKHVIAAYGEDPGIDEDDVYFFNDSYTAALHPPDVYLISPIHFDGRLTGFVANFVHVTDIGAIDPGGFSPSARDNYQEGFQTKGLKIVERGRPRRDVIDTFLNMVRDPGMTQLDMKSQLAANHVAKQRMHDLYRDYGLETVDAVSDELIGQSEELVRARLAELPDGRWRAREYVDMPGGSCRVELTATKRGDTLEYDFTGSSPQVELGINCCYWATWGAMFAPIFPLLAWDVTWNEGVTRPIGLVAPEGTVVNCLRPAPISIATVGTIQIVNNLSTIVLGKMFGASSRYADRATAVWHGSHAHLETHGLDAEGQFFVAPLTDTFCGAGGARALRDGVDLGGEIPNVVSRWANVESQELGTPLRYLYRRAVPDSGGPGKHRGGVCHEYAFTPSGGRGPMGLVLFGKGTRAPMSLGLFGGYPGCNVGYSTFRSANVDELPGRLDETRGADAGGRLLGPRRARAGRRPVRPLHGRRGLRRPDRPRPGARRARRRQRASSRRRPRGRSTASCRTMRRQPIRRRLEIRRERLGGRDPLEPAEISATGRRISEWLQQASDGSTQCTRCGTAVAPAGADWKEHGVLRRLPIEHAGPLRTPAGEFFLVEACCPGCGALLDTDVVLGDDPPLHDRIEHWPG